MRINKRLVIHRKVESAFFLGRIEFNPLDQEPSCRRYLDCKNSYLCLSVSNMPSLLKGL